MSWLPSHRLCLLIVLIVFILSTSSANPCTNRCAKYKNRHRCTLNCLTSKRNGVSDTQEEYQRNSITKRILQEKIVAHGSKPDEYRDYVGETVSKRGEQLFSLQPGP